MRISRVGNEPQGLGAGQAAEPAHAIAAALKDNRCQVGMVVREEQEGMRSGVLLSLKKQRCGGNEQQVSRQRAKSGRVGNLVKPQAAAGLAI